MNRAFIIALVALVAVSTACSSGSSGDTPVGPTFSAEFVPLEPNPGNDTVSAAEGGVGGNLVTVDINVTNTNGIYGASFDLTYDPSMANWLSFTEGNLLEQEGVPFYDVQEPQNGHLVVVATLVGAVNEANASGTRTIIGLTFEVIQEGESTMTFEAENLADDQGVVIPDINWFGGSLSATE